MINDSEADVKPAIFLVNVNRVRLLVVLIRNLGRQIVRYPLINP